MKMPQIHLPRRPKSMTLWTEHFHTIHSQTGPKNLSIPSTLQPQRCFKEAVSWDKWLTSYACPQVLSPGTHSKDEFTSQNLTSLQSPQRTHVNQRHASCLSNCSLESPKNFQIFRKNNKSLVGVKGIGTAKSKLQKMNIIIK